MRRAAYPLACGAALAALCAAYANHFGNAFHFDDDHTILNNLAIRELRNIPSFFVNPHTFSALPANQSYRPLTSATLAVDYWIGHGLDVRVFHATSFALFAALCVSALFLYRRLLDAAQPDGWNRWIALFAASWYALHTANAETVNYIIARTDILSTLCVVLALLMFTSRGRARTAGLYVIPALGAVFAKEQGAMVVPLLMLYVALFELDVQPRDLLRPRTIVHLLRATWPATLLCTAIVITGVKLSTTMNPGGTSVRAYLQTQPYVMAHYVRLFVLPTTLSADSDWQVIADPFDARVVLGVLFIAVSLLAAFAAWRRRKTRPIAFGILWFFIALLPTSSFVPLAEVTNDHRVFFPFVGLTLAAASAAGLLLRRATVAWPARRWMTPLACVAALALLTAHALGAWHRNIVWHTEESLWADVVQKSPGNARGLMTYGVIQMGKGRYDAAQGYFERALKIAPQYAYLHVNVAVLDGARGKPIEAEQHFRLAQQYDPGNPVSYSYYARWLDSVGRPEDALPQAERAVELSPGDADARALLDALRARVSQPRTPEYWLAVSLSEYQAQRYDASITASREALTLRPSYAEAYNNLCAAENVLGRYQEAIADCRSALAIKPDFPLARNNLAVALRGH